MKRFLSAALVLMLLFASCAAAEELTVSFTTSPAAGTTVPAPASTAAPAAASTAGTQTVTIRKSGDVNVRKDPSYTGARVGTAKAGRTYTLVETAENGWYKIRLADGIEGYISPKLVQGTPTDTTSRRVVIHSSGNANVREEPSADSRRVGVARAGKGYTLLAVDEATGWYKILISGGVVGYVSPKVVKKVTNPGEDTETSAAASSSSSSASSAAADTETETVRIRRAGNVNVRESPESSSERVGIATAGKRYPLLETTETGWYKIRLENGTEGYISGKLAKK